MSVRARQALRLAMREGPASTGQYITSMRVALSKRNRDVARMTDKLAVERAKKVALVRSHEAQCKSLREALYEALAELENWRESGPYREKCRLLDEAAAEMVTMQANLESWMDTAVARDKDREALSVELTALRQRITTIADEANGPHPVQTADESLTCIERALLDGRQAVETRRLRAKVAVERLREAFRLRPGCSMVEHAAEDAATEHKTMTLQLAKSQTVAREQYDEAKFLRARCTVMATADPTARWMWMSSEDNHLESMGEDMVVQMTAGELRHAFAQQDRAPRGKVRCYRCGQAHFILADIDHWKRPHCVECYHRLGEPEDEPPEQPDGDYCPRCNDWRYVGTGDDVAPCPCCCAHQLCSSCGATLEGVCPSCPTDGGPSDERS